MKHTIRRVYNICNMVHKTFDLRNLYVRDSLIDGLLTQWVFHSWFNFTTESFAIKKNETWHSYVAF